mmetsp:Transcript_62099/g.98014  ORF Transcript_62099/g.98014 Transcript_62099/m.98014 type:complete len:100 (-) Transcript_62099:72-371(-)
MSLELSPPMIEHNGMRLIDEVWHLHIAMTCYEEDCALLSAGNIITHQPVLADRAVGRYEHTYRLYLARCVANGEMIDTRCWPDPNSLRLLDPMWDGGCC